MDPRLKRVKRLVDVLSQLHRIEERKRIELQRRYDELQRSQQDIIRTLNKDDALHGLFIDTTARFLKTLAMEAQRVAEAREVQSRRLLDRAAKVKTAERLNAVLSKNAAHARKESELLDIIERYVGHGNASLPQD